MPASARAPEMKLPLCLNNPRNRCRRGFQRPARRWISWWRRETNVTITCGEDRQGCGRPRFRWTVSAVVAIAWLWLLVSGCGNPRRPKTVPVSGAVSWGDRAPEHPGALFFAPVEVAEGYPRRGGRALFDTDGKFVATSFDEGDGLVPGTYRVRVESWKEVPSMQSAGVSYVPAGFEAPTLVVSETERSVRYDLVIPVD